MQKLLTLFGALLTALVAVHGLHFDEVGVKDWHRASIGPVTGVQSQSGRILLSSATSLATVSESSSSGDLDWRFNLPVNQSFVHHQLLEGGRVVGVLSGGGVLVWGVDGELLVSHPFDASSCLSGGASVLALDSSLVVAVGRCLFRLSDSDGQVVWSRVSQSLVSPLALVPVGDGVALFGVSSSGYAVVDTLELAGGQEKVASSVSSTVRVSATILVAVSSSSPSRVAFVHSEGGYLYVGDLARSSPLFGYVALNVDASAVDQVAFSGDSIVLVRSGGDILEYSMDSSSLKVTFVSKDSTNSQSSLLIDDDMQELQSISLPSSFIGDIQLLSRRDRAPISAVAWSDVRMEKLFVSIREKYVIALFADKSVQRLDVSDSASSHVWVRHESLSAITHAEFVQLPAPEQLHKHYIPNSDDNIVMQMVNGWLFRLRHNFLTGEEDIGAHVIAGDKFGLKQLIVVTTDYGTVLGIDTVSGNVLWSMFFDGFKALTASAVRNVHSGEDPLVGVVLGKGNSLKYVEFNTLIEIVATSDISNVGSPSFVRVEVDQGHSAIGVFAESGSFQVYPASAVSQLADVAIRTFRVEKDTRGLSGYSGHLSNKSLTKMWTFSLGEGEELLSLSNRPLIDASASLGRVLGDRSVLYKYINPNMVVFATSEQRKGRLVMHIHLLDAVSGRLLRRITHNDYAHSKAHIAITENVIVYSYWAESDSSDSQKLVYPRMNVIELFESANDAQSTAFSSYGEINKTIESRAFQFRQPVSAMAFTSTAKGITSKELVFATASGQIGTIPRQVLDARRPMKPASSLTADEKEEKLVAYTPFIDVPATNFISHYLDVKGIDTIITWPCTLESSTMIFAYGFDLFFAIRTPSNEFDQLGNSFSKSMPLMAIVGLTVATFVSKYMVRRKKLLQVWK